MFDKTPRTHDIPRHNYEFSTISYEIRTSYAPLMPFPVYDGELLRLATRILKPFKILVAFPRHATSCYELGRLVYDNRRHRASSLRVARWVKVRTFTANMIFAMSTFAIVQI